MESQPRAGQKRMVCITPAHHTTFTTTTTTFLFARRLSNPQKPTHLGIHVRGRGQRQRVERDELHALLLRLRPQPVQHLPDAGGLAGAGHAAHVQHARPAAALCTNPLTEANKGVGSTCWRCFVLAAPHMPSTPLARCRPLQVVG